jgi:hypothetical protein
MRVKIAYTVELEEIESEVKEIMQKALLDMEQALEKATGATGSLDTGDEKIVSVIQSFDMARRKMAKADLILADCQEILLGYMQVLEQASEENKDEKN